MPIVLLFAASLATGCPGDDESGLDPKPDAGGVDVPTPEPTWSLPPITVQADTTAIAANYSCAGTDRSIRDGTVELSLGVTPFGAPPTVAIPGMTVQLFPSNVPELNDQCTGNCVELMSDDAGIVSVELASAAPLAYRVLPRDGSRPDQSFVRTVELGFVPPADSSVLEWFNTASEAVMTGLVASAGNQWDRARAVLSGRVRDCDGAPVQHSFVRIFRQDGSEVTNQPNAEQFVYFDGQVPPGIDLAATLTGSDGRWAAANITNGPKRIEAWGALEEEAEPVLLACVEIDAFADSLGVTVLKPLEAEPASACGSVPAATPTP